MSLDLYKPIGFKIITPRVTVELSNVTHPFVSFYSIDGVDEFDITRKFIHETLGEMVSAIIKIYTDRDGAEE